MAHSFEDDLDDDWEPPICPAAPLAEFCDPEIIGTILGPDGAPLHMVIEARPFPFGFSRGA